jgi:hypothetical protein
LNLSAVTGVDERASNRRIGISLVIVAVIIVVIAIAVSHPFTPAKQQVIPVAQQPATAPTPVPTSVAAPVARPKPVRTLCVVDDDSGQPVKVVGEDGVHHTLDVLFVPVGTDGVTVDLRVVTLVTENYKSSMIRQSGWKNTFRRDQSTDGTVPTTWSYKLPDGTVAATLDHFEYDDPNFELVINNQNEPGGKGYKGEHCQYEESYINLEKGLLGMTPGQQEKLKRLMGQR